MKDFCPVNQLRNCMRTNLVITVIIDVLATSKTSVGSRNDDNANLWILCSSFYWISITPCNVWILFSSKNCCHNFAEFSRVSINCNKNDPIIHFIYTSCERSWNAIFRIEDKSQVTYDILGSQSLIVKLRELAECTPWRWQNTKMDRWISMGSSIRRTFCNFLTRLREFHDDVIKWKHFPRYWPFVRGIQRSPVNSPPKGQWRGALMFSFISVWINGWVNNREAGDLIRYCVHYDVSVMYRGWMVAMGNGWMEALFKLE